MHRASIRARDQVVPFLITVTHFDLKRSTLAKKAKKFPLLLSGLAREHLVGCPGPVVRTVKEFATVHGRDRPQCKKLHDEN